MSFSHTGTTGHTPSDLSSILRRVKATLHDTRLQAQHLPSLPARDESDSSYRDASLDDLKEAFGACQTIEWKEQEYRYIRSKVIGHRRRDMVHGCRPPAVHKLLRSVSTPEAPQVESRSYKTFLRHRRESLALGTQSAAACGCGKPQRTAADRDDLCEFSGEVCDKILLYVKSNAWASRESLLSATSRSLASSDDLDDPSVAVDARDHIVAVDARDPSVAVDARDPSVAVDARDPSVDVDVGDPSVDVDVGGPSVAVDADNPSVAVDADNPSVAVDADNPNVAVDNNPSLTVGACDPSVSNIVDACHPGASTPITAAVTSILDNIPHIDSDDDDDDCQGDCVVASEVPSTNNVVQVVEKFSPELPPLCEPEDDLCEDDQCEDDHQVAQAQPAVVLNQTQHNEGAYKGVEAPGLDPSYAHGQLSCHAHPSSHAHSSCHAHSSSHAHSSCHAHDAFFDVSGYAHRQFSWQTRCHSSTQSHTQPPSHAHSQSSNHAHSQVSSHAHTHVINDEPSQVCEDDNHTSMNEATVAITGGFSRDGWAVAEVVMGGSGEMEAWLGQCCDPAHPHALPRPPHTPLLLLLHAHALHASPPLLHALKERVWGAGVHVCVVKPTPTARSIRRLITNSELQVELVSEEQLHERVPEDQLTPQFGGTLQLDHHAWSVFCKIRVEVLDQVRRGATMLETCVSLSPSPSLSPPHSLAPSTTTEVQEMHHCVASAKSSLRHMEKWCHRLHNHSLVRCWMSECEELVKTLEAVSSLAMDHRASRLSLLHQEANSVSTLCTFKFFLSFKYTCKYTTHF
ncbi:uncharacterized protein [Procambarus clarkii]|uniref:uncharacterized protein n=1 Tax=Procambarus clarkii TaxID=6728 RepID=UPI0037447980